MKCPKCGSENVEINWVATINDEAEIELRCNEACCDEVTAFYKIAQADWIMTED